MNVLAFVDLVQNKEEVRMRYVAFFAILYTLAGCGAERDRIIYQRHSGYDNYCHTKVETSPRDAVRPGDREIVDFYGPCDAFDNGSTLERRAEPNADTQ